MNKKINLFLVASILFYLTAIIGFLSGSDNSISVLWLCLGSAFLCFGATNRRKENKVDNEKDNETNNDKPL